MNLRPDIVVSSVKCSQSEGTEGAGGAGERADGAGGADDIGGIGDGGGVGVVAMGSLLPIEMMRLEFKHNEDIGHAIDRIKTAEFDYIAASRPTRGDGNCFWRAVSYSFLETLLCGAAGAAGGDGGGGAALEALDLFVQRLGAAAYGVGGAGGRAGREEVTGG